MRYVDLGINLLASLIFFVIGWLTQLGLQEYRRRGLLGRLWPVDDRRPFTIFVGQGPTNTYHDNTIYEGDAVAASLLVSFLRRSFPRTQISIRSSRTSDGDRAIVGQCAVVGGPATNALRRKIETLIELPFAWIVHEHHAEIQINDDERRYSPRIENGATFEDYATIVFCQNPWSPNERMLLIAGCSEAGTIAASDFVTTPAGRQVKQRVARQGRTCLVLRVPVHGAVVGHPQLCDVISF